MSVVTATAGAANKIWIFKRKMAFVNKNTRGSLAAINDYYHLTGGCFPSIYGLPLPFFYGLLDEPLLNSTH